MDENYVSFESVMSEVDNRINELMKDEAFRRKNAHIDLYGIKRRITELPSFSFNILRQMCKYHTLSYDSYTDKWESACHHHLCIPQGSSWGICSEQSCPFIQHLYRGERT